MERLLTDQALGQRIGYTAAVVCIVLWLCVTTVPAGHVGIVDVFGSVSPNALQPGLRLVNPFAKVVPMSVQTQMVEVAEDVPTKEGLTVHLEAAALFYLKPSEAAKMYSTVGANYRDTVVAPQFRSIVREVTSGHEAKDLYTSARLQMTSSLKKQFGELVRHRGIEVEETPLKKLELPHALQQSIENKLEAEQASQKMAFVLQKERQEAERKKIEADGIALFQDLVSGDVSTGLLRWKGIEATESIAESSNPKTVIIGSKGGSTPMILGNDAPKR
uniref:Prohibitin n=1 Tax=Eutreptiella gymnastica TaxID=73025 RepID=A0A7S1IB59_9EUGL|mmetsp:Transcript_144071/g.251435  ORF Transcript_144071/g.251435 Transcript_144071/m.251435 type:complete len:275 (+) Transcript_144071:26-850(+)